MSKEPMLVIKEISKNFGGVQALENLSFEVNPGEILGLIGPNGSGKTTLFNVATGIYNVDSGQILFEGKDITRSGRHTITDLGIARTFQTARVFFWQTVENNIKTAMIVRTIGKNKIDQKTQKERLEYILDLTKLQAWRNIPATALTAANQRRLMLANALGTFPKLLMLDEIVAGMSGEEQNETQEMVRKVHKDGVTILMIEHNMRIAMTTADRIVAINFGHKIAEGPPKEISRNDKVIEAYLGSEEKYA